MKSATLSTMFLFVGFVSGCSFYARSPEDYRQATEELLETRRPQIKECYQETLKSNKDATGTVVVHFKVEEKTGKIMNPEVLPESTAPTPLNDCVVEAMNGLALQPPDQREGDATFAYQFE